MEEQWRDIPGFEGFYEASTLGRIISVNRRVGTHCGLFRIAKKTVLSPYRGRVELWKNGIAQNFAVERLLAITWPGLFTLVNRRRIRRVRRSDGIEFDSLTEAAKVTGCAAGNISAVCNGQGKKSGGYGWSYCDGQGAGLPAGLPGQGQPC